MNRPQVIEEAETQQHMRAGINLMADLFACTLGPASGAVIGQTDLSAGYEIFSDSNTTARRILSLGSPTLDIGAMAVRSIVMEASSTAGDGGATAAVIMRAVYQAAARRVAAGVSPMQIMRELNAGAVRAAEIITASARPIHSEDDLAKLARSVVNDADLAVMLGEMSYLLGADGYINIKKFVAPYLQREYIAGAHMKAKIASASLYSDIPRKASVLNRPLVALTKSAIKETEEIVRLMEAALARKATALVIIGEVSGKALTVLVANQQLEPDKKKLNLLATKLSAVGDARTSQYDDLALITGATVLGDSHGHSVGQTQPHDLGQAQRVDYVDGFVATVADPARRAAVQVEVDDVRSRLAALASDDEDRQVLIERLGRLTGGVGELKIGAHTKPARTQREQLARRALHVLAHAHRDGIVPGGGAALHHCADVLRAERDATPRSAGRNHGLDILIDALSEPMRQIITNAGVDEPSVKLAQVSEAGSTATYDALAGQLCDAFDDGIVDATTVVIEAMQAAVSGAAMAISTGAIVYHKNPQAN